MYELWTHCSRIRVIAHISLGSDDGYEKTWSTRIRHHAYGTSSFEDAKTSLMRAERGRTTVKELGAPYSTWAEEHKSSLEYSWARYKSIRNFVKAKVRGSVNNESCEMWVRSSRSSPTQLWSKASEMVDCPEHVVCVQAAPIFSWLFLLLLDPSPASFLWRMVHYFMTANLKTKTLRKSYSSGAPLTHIKVTVPYMEEHPQFFRIHLFLRPRERRAS